MDGTAGSSPGVARSTRCRSGGPKRASSNSGPRPRSCTIVGPGHHRRVVGCGSGSNSIRYALRSNSGMLKRNYACAVNCVRRILSRIRPSAPLPAGGAPVLRTPHGWRPLVQIPRYGDPVPSMFALGWYPQRAGRAAVPGGSVRAVHLAKPEGPILRPQFELSRSFYVCECC